MFNTTEIIIEAFIKRLRDNYYRTYGSLEPEFPNIISFFGRLALENIANSDAAYHNLDHTIMVTEAGQQILRGRHLLRGDVNPTDWMHVTVACLCHDIGYVRGVLRSDSGNRLLINEHGDYFDFPADATDAILAPYHVDRGIIFVKEWLKDVALLNGDRIAAMIDFTRFPIPSEPKYAVSSSFSGMVRAADLIGQMGDVNYLRKSPALFAEFVECKTHLDLGYTSPKDLRANYPPFFWNVIKPVIQDAIRFLEVTQEGKVWVSTLYAHVFTEVFDVKYSSGV